jgi:pimeloyl-ACP methyl ester carboxylesterase
MIPIAARLARWLGPWADESRSPAGVERRTVRIAEAREGDRAFDAWVLRPARREPRGSLLVVPGLHYAGPADPRLERFLRILANAGIVVLSPFLPDFAELRVGRGLVRDTERALEALIALPGRPAGRPGMFSISFGSHPALSVAASERCCDAVGGLVVFGGYADFASTLRFALRGEPGRPHDPLNRPVVFLNLLEHLEDVPRDASRVIAAWDEYVRTTWGRPEMKAHERWSKVAREIGDRLAGEERAFFLLGCGALGGGVARCEAALRAAGDAFDWLDPRPLVGGIRCPVYLVHGRDDDVIPYTEAAKLRDAIEQAMPARARVTTLVTGMYAHTGKTGLAQLASLGPTLAGELRAMTGILAAIADVATDRARSRATQRG